VICLSVALHAEAQSLIGNYSLARRSHRGLFPVYSTPGLALVVSGVGKLAAAGAVAYLNTLLGEPDDCGWLNVGVAGHPKRRCGEGLLARRITEAASGRSWILRTDIAPQLECERLITVDAPETEYAEPAMYDMEAAGFYASARLCTDKERIQCFKVISDNRSNTPSQLTPTRVRRLIDDHLEDVERLIQGLNCCPS
jgi:hypothetical protein